MKRKNQTLDLFMAACLAVLLVQACGLPADSGGDEITNPQTEILNISVQPDTVAPSDTASFTCIIEDSTDKRFKFYWYIDTGKILDASLFDNHPVVYETDTNNVKWVAPNKSGFNSFTVLAANGSEDSTSVEQSFVIIVEE